MGKAAQLLKRFFLPAIAVAMLLTACENDLKNVRAISAKQATNAVDSSLTVEVTYSDSAHVKALMTAPLLLDFKPAGKPYHEMPKGIKIVFYDKNLKIVSTVVSDYAITANDDKIITLKKNVVVTNNEGDTFKSEELIWDSLQKIIYSTKPVVINKIDGTVLNYSNFKSNEKGTDYTGDNGYGTIITKGNITQ